MRRKYGPAATFPPVPGSTGAAAFGNILSMNGLRIAALATLAAALVLAVLDLLETLVARNWNGMAAGYLWSIIWPSSLSAVKDFVEDNISLILWQRILLPILMLPAWVLLFGIGILMLVFGKRSED